MNARDAILARVREALTVPGPGPHQRAGEMAGHGAAPHSAPLPLGNLPVLALEAARPWLPDGGATPEERLALLADNLGKLKAVFHRVPTIHAAQDLLFSIARERDWKRVAWHAHPLVEPILSGIPCATHRVDGAAAVTADPTTDSSLRKDALEACDAGITGCDALVAQTGSILVSSASCGGRCMSSSPCPSRSWRPSPTPSTPSASGTGALSQACSPSSPARVAPATSSGSSSSAPTARRNCS